MGKEEKEQRGKKIVLINPDHYLSRAVLPLPPPQPQIQPEQSSTCLSLLRAHCSSGTTAASCTLHQDHSDSETYLGPLNRPTKSKCLKKPDRPLFSPTSMLPQSGSLQGQVKWLLAKTDIEGRSDISKRTK